MGFRVADPKRLRLAALVATLVGAAWVIFGATRGPVLLLGVPVMALGVAAFDLARHGRPSIRQAALVVTIVAAGFAMWTFFVIVFIGTLGEGGASWIWYVLLLLSVVFVVAGLLTLARPQTASALSGVVGSVTKGRGRRRAPRRRHAAPASRAPLERRSSFPRSAL